MSESDDTNASPPDLAGPAATQALAPPPEVSLASLAQRNSTFEWRLSGTATRGEAAEPNSRFLHLAEQGTVLRREGTRIRITKKDVVLREIPAMKIQGVLVYGNVQISTQCLRNLLEEGAWIAFFTRSGRYRGRLQPPVERGGRLRRRQWECAGDVAFCLSVGKALVRAKLLGQKQIAAGYAKNYLAETLGQAQTQLRRSLERVESVEDLAELRGVEGSASRAYFDGFGRFNRSEMPFDGREKRPAPDPINALLSFGYTLLTQELEGLLEAAGLDPTIGFYHQPHDDRPSLACDWVEEFRHVVVDRLVLNLVNLGTMTKADFEERDDGRSLRLTPDGLRKFLQAYERALTGLDVSDAAPVPGVAGGVRGLFLRQLPSWLDALSGRGPYVPHLT